MEGNLPSMRKVVALLGLALTVWFAWGGLRTVLYTLAS